MKVNDNVVVNGNGGAFVNLTCNQASRKVTIDEDPVNGAGVGIEYQLPDENFAITHFLGVGEQLVLQKSTVAGFVGMGGTIGYPAQQKSSGLAIAETIAATIYAKVRSHTAVATKGRYVESD